MIIRAVVWVFGAFILSLIPLGIVAIIAWKPETGGSGYLSVLSNEELLAVAFTLGGAAAIDVLVNSSGSVRLFKIIAGCSAMTLTIIVVIAYIIFKAHLVHLNERALVTTIQYLYAGTIVNAFIFEILSEA
jgi:hypothetical protein